MRTLTIPSLTICTLLWVLLSAAGPVAAQGWQPLFDGQSLRGWTTLDGQPVTRGWEAVDGAIHLNVAAGRAGEYDRAEYEDTSRCSVEDRRGGMRRKYRVRILTAEALGCDIRFTTTRRKDSMRGSTGFAVRRLRAVGNKPLNPAGLPNRSPVVVQGNHIEQLRTAMIVEAVARCLGASGWPRASSRTYPDSARTGAVGSC
jgi:hypothetical protein